MGGEIVGLREWIEPVCVGASGVISLVHLMILPVFLFIVIDVINGVNAIYF